MQPPYSDELNIGDLSRVFDRNRVSNSYKYFWFKAIVNNVSYDKIRFTYNELINEMIVSAYYMVNEYNLRLGPCNTVDNLEEISKYIYKEYHYPSTVNDSVLRAFLKITEDSKIKEYKRTLTYNVPYCLQSPFYTDLKSPSKAKVDEINKCKRLLYYFVAINNLASEIEINEIWLDYLVRNREILKCWMDYKLIGWLQDRNPSVPGISDKTSYPLKRELKKVRDYWKLVIDIDGSIKEIYDDVDMSDETVSIDHFVPWQYVAHDELWNLHPTTKSLNSQKSNYLPGWTYFSELGELQYRAYLLKGKNERVAEEFDKCAQYHLNQVDIRQQLYVPGLEKNEFIVILSNILLPVYKSAQLCGFKEWFHEKENI